MMIDRIRTYPNISANLCGVFADCCVLMLEHKISGETTLEFFEVELPAKTALNSKHYLPPITLTWNPIDIGGYGDRNRMAEDAGYGMVLLYLMVAYPEADWDHTLTFRTERGSGIDIQFEVQFKVGLTPKTATDDFNFLSSRRSIGIESKAVTKARDVPAKIKTGVKQIHQARASNQTYSVLKDDREYRLIVSEFESPAINVVLNV